MQDLNKRLKALRIEKGVTQEQMARDTGITQAAISKWESSDTIPKLEFLVKLAKYFGCSIDYLVGVVED